MLQYLRVGLGAAESLFTADSSWMHELVSAGSVELKPERDSEEVAVGVCFLKKSDRKLAGKLNHIVLSSW